MSAVSMVGVTAVGAFTTIVIARTLGPRRSGAYFVAQSLLVLLIAARRSGIAHGILYFVKRGEVGCAVRVPHGAQDDGPLGACRRSRGTCSATSGAFRFAGLPVWLVAIAVAGLPFALAWLFASFVALATDRYEAFVLPPIAPATGALALAVLGALLYGVNGAVIGMTASTVLVGVGTAVWAFRELPAGGLTRRRAVAPRDLVRAQRLRRQCASASQLPVRRVRAGNGGVCRHGGPVTLVAFAVTSVLWLLPSALADVLFRESPTCTHESTRAAEQLEMVETKSVRHATIVARGKRRARGHCAALPRRADLRLGVRSGDGARADSVAWRCRDRDRWRPLVDDRRPLASLFTHFTPR